jgi:hypothetical protein
MRSGYKARGRPEKRWPIDDQALVVSEAGQTKACFDTGTEIVRIVRMAFVSCVCPSREEEEAGQSRAGR